MLTSLVAYKVINFRVKILSVLKGIFYSSVNPFIKGIALKIDNFVLIICCNIIALITGTLKQHRMSYVETMIITEQAEFQIKRISLVPVFC